MASMQDLFIIKLMNNFTVAMKSSGAMALSAPPVAPPLKKNFHVLMEFVKHYRVISLSLGHLLSAYNIVTSKKVAK